MLPPPSWLRVTVSVKCQVWVGSSTASIVLSVVGFCAPSRYSACEGKGKKCCHRRGETAQCSACTISTPVLIKSIKSPVGCNWNRENSVMVSVWINAVSPAPHGTGPGLQETAKEEEEETLSWPKQAHMRQGRPGHEALGRRHVLAVPLHRPCRLPRRTHADVSCRRAARLRGKELATPDSRQRQRHRDTS